METRAARVEAVRRFSRFYTRRIGVLEEGLLASPFPLAEARLIYELAHHEEVTAAQLSEELGLDAGYVSRLLGKLESGGVVERRDSPADGRVKLLSLTEAGERAFAQLNAASRSQIEEMLESLSPEEERRLVEAMSAIERILGAAPESRVPYILRPPEPGDLGWVIQRHGALYSRERGWDEEFEGLSAEIVARFVREYKPKRERCWIAEKDGQPVGCVFVVERSESVAQLRMLLVEPSARGLGIGRRLVSECTAFARRAGYDRIMLWTTSDLTDARRLYEREGYRLVEEEPQRRFGHDIVGQTWELEL